METKTKLLLGLAVIAAGLTGAATCNTLGSKPTKEQVRTALYEQCVNSSAYSPKEDNKGDSLHCNRRSIDLFMAVVYDGSYISPIDVDEYEAALKKYKHPN